jgi:hypothetical protein
VFNDLFLATRPVKKERFKLIARLNYKVDHVRLETMEDNNGLPLFSFL